MKNLSTNFASSEGFLQIITKIILFACSVNNNNPSLKRSEKKTGMNLLKKSELLLLKQQSILPAIPMPSSFSSSTQKIERNGLDRKESDFIKRLKKTKSIMIAQKNRKQKNILNPHFMDMRKRKSNQTHNTKSNYSVAISPKNLQPIQQKQQQLQKFFPLVHSSIQICLNACKNIKSKQLRVQASANETSSIGQYLLGKSKQRKNKRVNRFISEEYQKQAVNDDKKSKIIETERQNLNYTAIQEEPENVYKSQKKLDPIKATYHKLKAHRMQYKHRNLTQQSKLSAENEKLGGWEFRSFEDEGEIL